VHELGMCEDVLRAVERRADGRRVAAIGVRTGTLLRVVPAAFQQAFDMVAVGSVAEGAITEVTNEPVDARCERCGTTYRTDDPFAACVACGGVDLAIAGGDDLVLEWLRYHPA
jgi:hydrogenase nickel incorporation protein HypA/HybF